MDLMVFFIRCFLNFEWFYFDGIIQFDADGLYRFFWAM